MSKFSIQILLIALVALTCGVRAEAYEGFLDAHVHFYPRGFSKDSSVISGQMAFLRDNLFEKALLLSPSFGIFKGNGYAELFPWLAKESMIHGIDRELSAYIQREGKDRFLGLCGANLRWAHLSRTVVKCLGLPKMVGVKLRHDDEFDESAEIHPFLSESYRKKTKDLLDAIQHFQPIVLWHLHYDEANNDHDGPKATRHLLEMVRTYPEITFVFAHGMGNIGLASILSLTGQDHMPKNFFVEVSGTTFIEVPPSPQGRYLPEETINLWRQIGMSHILFGSDTPALNSGELLRAIQTSTFLTAEEKSALLNSNGQTFWNSLKKRDKSISG